jgi:hypothetical protein
MPDVKSFALGKALLYAGLLWVAGFFWGSIVYMTPALKSVPPIAYVSGNPVISFPILLVWLVLSWLLARNFLKGAERKADAGRQLGIVFVLVNLVLDLVVLVVLLKAGFGFYASLSIWVAYAILFAVPWRLGRRQP